MIDSVAVGIGNLAMNFGCGAHTSINMGSVEELSDEELMRESQTASIFQQPDIFLDEIFKRYEKKMRHWCTRFTRDADQAVDLAQDVFLKAFEHVHSYRGESKVSTWLYAIARNHCLAHLRKRRIPATNITESVSGSLDDANALRAFRSIEDEQLYTLMRRAMLTALGPLEAKVMILHYVQGIPLETVTQTLKLGNPSGAKAYVLKGRRKLSWALRTRGSKSAAAAKSHRKLPAQKFAVS